MGTPVVERLGLSLQQPWAELILRGVKTIEVRSLPVRPGKEIYLYAGKRVAGHPGMEQLLQLHKIDLAQLPRGLVVGTVEIVECRPASPEDGRAACVSREMLDGKYSWLLANPRRLSRPLPALHVPYGVWFYPFRPVSQPTTRRGKS